MDAALTFLCDSMLGGLARWLRAAGYDTVWQEHISDPDLVLKAEQEGRFLLSSDGDIFLFRRVQDGPVRALQVPRSLPVEAQLHFVLEKLHLPIRPPRCMPCGGPLFEVPKEAIRDKVPHRTFEWLDQFWECQRCRKIFWQGTHWQRISARLGEMAAGR